jgi:type VI secretion system protein ImpG
VDISLDRLSTLYLTELSRLDSFAAERESEFALDSGRDDPDVRRLIEAMAFFSARTRSGAIGAVESAVRRLAAGTLDELLVPTPAAMMVQAVPGEQLVEPVQLVSGLPLQATTKDGREGVFTTERALTLLPVETKEAILTRGHRRVEIVIKVAALRPLSKATTLSFYVRRLDDYRASLALYDAIERHFVRAHAESDDVGELPCRVEFGARESGRFGPEDEAGELGPLASIRSFFQLPEQELFLRVTVPAAPGGWNDLSVRLELDEAFPEEFGVSADTFQLGVVPCVNRWVDFAQPIECDGTRISYPVRSGEAMLDAVELHELRGVYRSSDQGLTPMVPAALARQEDSFEFEPGAQTGEGALRLDIADAFENSCLVQVEASWSQPRLWSAPAGRIKLGPRTRRLPGVTFRTLGPVHPAHPSPLARDPARCLDVLALKVRPELRRRDLIGMLEILGAGGDSSYRGIPSLIDELESSQNPDPAQRAGGIRRLYKMAVRCRSAEEEPLLRRMAREAAKLLDVWTEDAVDVEIVTRRQMPGRVPLKESA